MTEHEEQSLPAELKVLDGRVGVLLSRISEVRVCDEESYKLVAELAKEAKAKQYEVEERSRRIIEAAYTVWKDLTSRRKVIMDGFIEAEKLAKDKMANFALQQESEGHCAPQADGIVLSDVWEGQVVDPAKIPRKFLMPNLKALEEHTKRYKDATKIPGWAVVKTKRVTART